MSHALAKYLKRYQLTHIRSAPYHPMSQVKIECYHRSMKKVVKPETFFFPWDLEQTITAFVKYYNQERYDESLDNLTPADVYFGRAKGLKDTREEIKQKTMKQRRQRNRQMAPNTLSLDWRVLS